MNEGICRHLLLSYKRPVDQVFDWKSLKLTEMTSVSTILACGKCGSSTMSQEMVPYEPNSFCLICLGSKYEALERINPPPEWPGNFSDRIPPPPPPDWPGHYGHHKKRDGRGKWEKHHGPGHWDKPRFDSPPVLHI